MKLDSQSKVWIYQIIWNALGDLCLEKSTKSAQDFNKTIGVIARKLELKKSITYGLMVYLSVEAQEALQGKLRERNRLAEDVASVNDTASRMSFLQNWATGLLGGSFDESNIRGLFEEARRRVSPELLNRIKKRRARVRKTQKR